MQNIFWLGLIIVSLSMFVFNAGYQASVYITGGIGGIFCLAGFIIAFLKSSRYDNHSIKEKS